LVEEEFDARVVVASRSLFGGNFLEELAAR
jgi:hypothetical protein